MDNYNDLPVPILDVTEVLGVTENGAEVKVGSETYPIPIKPLRLLFIGWDGYSGRDSRLIETEQNGKYVLRLSAILMDELEVKFNAMRVATQFKKGEKVEVLKDPDYQGKIGTVVNLTAHPEPMYAVQFPDQPQPEGVGLLFNRQDLKKVEV